LVRAPARRRRPGAEEPEEPASAGRRSLRGTGRRAGGGRVAPSRAGGPRFPCSAVPRRWRLVEQLAPRDDEGSGRQRSPRRQRRRRRDRGSGMRGPPPTRAFATQAAPTGGSDSYTAEQGQRAKHRRQLAGRSEASGSGDRQPITGFRAAPNLLWNQLHRRPIAARGFRNATAVRLMRSTPTGTAGTGRSSARWWPTRSPSPPGGERTASPCGWRPAPFRPSGLRGPRRRAHRVRHADWR